MLTHESLQANPLNTYLSSKPAFTSPQPLAAASGLTIPLQITLSEIRLSAFIIIVFSKQKGLTLVFRNDPLESLKVSSTFDSIQFVRDYLQRTIEGKLRDLMMDELPAIIHRLSLQLWCPDQVPKDEVKEDDEPAINPFATPPVDAVDASGHLLDASEISSLSLEGGLEVPSLFSQRNLIQLAALTSSQRTFSLFTPGLLDMIYRAKAGYPERPDPSTTPSLTAPTLKSHSHGGSVTVHTFSDTSSQDHGHLPSRPSLVSLQSATTGLSLGSGRHSKAGRRKKTRVVNLRNKTASGTTSEVASESGDTASETVSVVSPMSEPIMSFSIPEEPEEEVQVGELSTPTKVRFQPRTDRSQPPPRPSFSRSTGHHLVGARPEETVPIQAAAAQLGVMKAKEAYSETGEASAADRKGNAMFAEPKSRRGPQSDTSSVILEQAWIMKMAGEIARRVYDEKNRNPHFWEEREECPPPAYQST